MQDAGTLALRLPSSATAFQKIRNALKTYKGNKAEDFPGENHLFLTCAQCRFTSDCSKKYQAYSSTSAYTSFPFRARTREGLDYHFKPKPTGEY